MSEAPNLWVDINVAGRLLSDSALESMERLISAPNLYRSMGYRQRTWEERLEIAIRQRSIRYRFRRLRDKWSNRVSMAVDVLRGEHYCDEDD